MKSNTLWGEAGIDGIFLALVTIAVTTIDTFVPSSVLQMILWIAKLVFTIWLLRYFMLGFKKRNENSSAFRFGFATSFCSALLCGVYSFVLYQYICPEQITETIDTVVTSIASTGNNIPDEVSDALLKLEDNFAQLSCVVTFLWCTFLGLIFSAILAKKSNSGKDVFTNEELNGEQQ